jgi:hypothetical protein
MLYEMKFEIDEPQFTQREVLGVIDLPSTTLNTWIKRNQLDPFTFERDFLTPDERIEAYTQGREASVKVRVYKVFQHDPAVRRTRLYSVLDTLCLAGMKALLEANPEIRFAYQFPELLCDQWTDQQLLNMGRHSLSEEPIILYIDEGRLMSLLPPTPYRQMFGKEGDSNIGDKNVETIAGAHPHRLEIRDLTRAMRDAKLTTVTVIDWPTVEDKVIDGLKRIIDVRGHRSWGADRD